MRLAGTWVARGKGSIINMSALGGGLVGLGRGNAIYCATKGPLRP